MRFPIRMLLATLLASPGAILHAQAAPAQEEPSAAEQDRSGALDNGEAGHIPTWLVDEAIQRFSFLPGIASESVRATVSALAAEAEGHRVPGMSSSQRNDEFRAFAACLAGNLWSRHLNRSYPDDIQSYAEQQVHGCAPFFRSENAQFIALVATLVEGLRPPD